ncbi:membrane protein insertase YidC [Treponema primitia]|uniref:membrane protein insertase YidC n=1 Tax=Treponema primitia TaxID=88058 RepID=UPI00025556A3|nr:membrane protein insertase YidC [Treponema primitia]
MLNILFNIIIYPVKLLLESIYAVLSISLFKENIGISLAGLSITVNLLCLPLYAKAEQLQQVERDIQKKMASRIADIKKYFKGDEQYMILAMHYKEHHYHPIMALRSSLSLLIQIPFFIAAYSFLSHLDSLTGKSLFLISDLSTPDALFSINNFSINILPILMTIINIISGLVYAKGFAKKEKIQLLLMSLIFLVLLYNSPSGLVLYWTMNNIFSLVKNILFKIKNPLKILYAIGCVLCGAFMVYVLFFRYNNPMRAFRNKFFSAIVFIVFTGIPLYLFFVKCAVKKWSGLFSVNLKDTKNIMILSCVNLCLFIGCFIPFNLVASDPVQFASIPKISSPFSLLVSPAIQAIGLLVFWPLYLFFLASNKIKIVLSVLFPLLVICSFLNFFVFSGNYGIISQSLNFQLRDGIFLAGSLSRQLVNILACVITSILLSLLFVFKKTKLISGLLSICILGNIFLCTSKLFQIKTVIDHDIEFQNQITNNAISNDTNDIISPVFTLGKTGKNVFIIMLDTAISSYFPIFLEERPEFRQSFSGFTYYPNTLSFFRRTLFGTPPLFGGYEYTPINMNERNSEKMKDKHNESMLVLPKLFKQHGFNITVTDMPYVNYESPMNPDFFTQRGIKAQNISTAYIKKYIHDIMGLDEYIEITQIAQLLNRNILPFAILEASPYILRDFLYQNGNYWSTADFSTDSGIPLSTISNYASLFYLPQITNITENDNTFSILVNNLTHDAVYLQYPDYSAEKDIINHGRNIFGNLISFKYYHTNSASYILLAKWFDYLRQNGVWDNTRIIIVSDHGDGGLTNPDFTSFQNDYVIPYNPILLIKDFSDKDDLKTNNDFMTNADVPLLATKDIIENPINPFTKRALEPDKKDGIYIFTEGYTNTSFYTGNTLLQDNSKFFYVHNPIFDQKNWRELQYKDFKTN